MRKKILSMLLVAAMAVGMLVGCGNETKQETKESSSQGTSVSEEKKSEESSEKPEVKEDPVTVTWLVAQQEPADLQMVMADLNQKIVEEINVEINLVCIAGGEYNDRVKLASTSGEDFDIVFTSNWRNNFDENMARGAFLEISNLIDQYGQDIVANLQPELWDVATVNGGIYAIPNQQIAAKQTGIYIQKEYADKYGWTATHIESHEELEWFLEKIKENEKDMFPIFTSTAPFDTGYETITSICSVATDDDPSDGLTVVWDTEDAKEDFLLDWYNKGYLHPEYATGGDLNAAKKANKFVCFGGSAYPYSDVAVSNSQGVEYICVTFQDAYFSSTAGKDTMFGINVNSKNPDAAVKLINLFWAKPELFNELLFGLEGVHYKKTAEDRVELIEGADWSLWKSDWAYGNQFSRWKVPGEGDDVWDKISEMNRTSVVSPIRGFTPDTSNLQVEIAQVSAVKNEYSYYFVRENKDELRAEYKQKLKDAGADTITAEIQRQLDEWLAANK